MYITALLVVFQVRVTNAHVLPVRGGTKTDSDYRIQMAVSSNSVLDDQDTQLIVTISPDHHNLTYIGMEAGDVYHINFTGICIYLYVH